MVEVQPAQVVVHHVDFVHQLGVLVYERQGLCVLFLGIFIIALPLVGHAQVVVAAPVVGQVLGGLGQEFNGRRVVTFAQQLFPFRQFLRTGVSTAHQHRRHANRQP